MRTTLILFLLFILSYSCGGPEKPKSDDVSRVVSRLITDPSRLNPLLHPTSRAREVYPYIMLPLADVNPITLEMDPVLIKAMPEAEELLNDEFPTLKKFTLELLPDAKWSDGSDVTAEDFIFTIKLIYHKGLNLAGWKSVYSNIIEEIKVDPENPKKFEIIAKKSDNTSLTYLTGVEVYPRSLYDPADKLGKYSLNQLLDESNYDEMVAADPALAEFATEFQEPKYSIEVVEGAGPYQLTAWENDQFIALKKKENYWGDNYPDRFQLQGNPSEIIFQIIQDDVNVINQLDGESINLAVLQSTSGDRFLELKEDKLIADKYNFYTPQLMRYLSIQMNNENPILSDKKVRKALSHLMNVQRLIDVGEGGVGKRVSSIFMDFRPYYNDQLSPIPFDVAEAKKLLAEAGWSDTNGDGTIDKVIDGQREELELRLYSTTSALGERVALNMKEGAAQAGIDINIISQSWKITLPQNVKTGDYDLVPMMNTLSPVDIPYRKWHSSEIGGQGTNYTRFSNEKADELLEELQTTYDEEGRNKLLYDIQQVIYDEYPVIMLYAPVEKIVVSKNLDPLITTKRPGYLLNAFQSAQ